MFRRRVSGPLGSRVGGEEGSGRRPQDLHSGIDAEHGRVDHQVVEAGIGRVRTEQPLDELRSGLVGLDLPAFHGAKIEPLDRRRPGHPALDRAVETDVIGARPGAQDHRAGPAQQHARGPGRQVTKPLLGPPADGLVVVDHRIGRNQRPHAGGPGEVAQKTAGRGGRLFVFVQALRRTRRVGGPGTLVGAGRPPAGGFFGHVGADQSVEERQAQGVGQAGRDDAPTGPIRGRYRDQGPKHRSHCRRLQVPREERL